MAFRKTKKVGGNSGGGGGFSFKNLLIQPGKKCTVVKDYLTEDHTTKIRILPSIYEGEEELALNPEGTADDAPEDVLGSAFFIAEVAKGIGSNATTFISGNNMDNEGNVVSEGWSATTLCVHRLKYKLIEADILKKHNHEPDVPTSWIKWLNRIDFMVKKPSVQLMMQCVLLSEDGKVPQDPKTGKPRAVAPALMVVPRSAMPMFLTDLRSRVDETEPLSMENNLIGDICTLDGGNVVLLRKIKNHDSDSSNSHDYNLKNVNKAMPITLEKAKKLFTPWEDLVYIPTVEEQIQILVDAFDAAAVDYALRGSEYEPYLPDGVSGASEGIEDACNIKDLRANIKKKTHTGAAKSPTRTAEGRAPRTEKKEESDDVTDIGDDINLMDLDAFEDMGDDELEGLEDVSLEEADGVEIPVENQVGIDSGKFRSALSAMEKKRNG